MYKVNKYVKEILAAILILTLITGCVGDKRSSVTEKKEGLKIVTTIFPAYDFARAAAGEHAEISMLIKPGAEVHSFDPSPADIISIKESDVFIYIGGESDVWVETILKSANISETKTIRLMDFVNPLEEELKEGMEQETAELEQHAESAALYDEHIWTSPKNAALLVEAISKVLCQTDTAGADIYSAGARSYIEEITALDLELKLIVDSAPLKKIIVADRFPFRYLVDEYGLDYSAALAGCDTQANCSPATLAFLIDSVMEEKIPYVYYVEFSNRNIAEIVKEQTGADTLLLHSCHNISKNEFENGATYLSLMRQNAESLKKGLGL